MRLPPIIRRLNSWSPILPVGNGSGAGLAAGGAGAAAVWATAGVGCPRPSGTAADAMREVFTKPRRDMFFSMGRAIAVPGPPVKHGTKAEGESRARVGKKGLLRGWLSGQN